MITPPSLRHSATCFTSRGCGLSGCSCINIIFYLKPCAILYFCYFQKYQILIHKQQPIMSVISVGTMAFDAIETPFGKVDKIIGGSGTYVAYAACNFVKPIQQISIVGYDFPQQELDELTSRGVQLAGVETVPDKKSFFWSGKYHLDMNTRDTLVTDLNVLADFNPVVPASY